MEHLEPADWCRRCARRLGELDETILPGEARDMAKDLHAFERTRAMAPEQAAEFVAAEMANTERQPFERRAVDRHAAAPSLARRRAPSA